MNCCPYREELWSSREGEERMKHYLSGVLIVLALLSTCAVGVGYYLMARASEAESSVSTPSFVMGYLSFLSSEQVRANNNQGIDDEVQVDLTHISSPVAQKSYYAWLLSDKDQSDPLSILLGVLTVKEGAAHLFYRGSLQHTNLLEVTGRFLVTEEDATLTPVSPSPDTSTWHYFATFAQTLPASSHVQGNTNKGGTNGGSTQSIQLHFAIYPVQKGA